MTSISIDPIEIRRFSKPASAEPSELRQLSDHMESVAVSVEGGWSKMQPKLREALIAFAYKEPELPTGFRKYVTVLRAGFWFARLTLKGEQNEVYNFGIAHRRLINAILSAIERDDPAYLEGLSKSIDEAFADLESSKTLEPEDTLGQLRQLSDEALR